MSDGPLSSKSLHTDGCRFLWLSLCTSTELRCRSAISCFSLMLRSKLFAQGPSRSFGFFNVAFRVLVSTNVCLQFDAYMQKPTVRASI